MWLNQTCVLHHYKRKYKINNLNTNNVDFKKNNDLNACKRIAYFDVQITMKFKLE